GLPVNDLSKAAPTTFGSWPALGINGELNSMLSACITDWPMLAAAASREAGVPSFLMICSAFFRARSMGSIAFLAFATDMVPALFFFVLWAVTFFFLTKTI